MKEIKGIIYDLDGTIISTQKLHKNAWLSAAEKFGVSLTEEMLFNQQGVSDETSAPTMLPSDKKHLIEDFIKAKKSYSNENIGQTSIFPDVIKTIDKLISEGINVWICTSAREGFVKKVLDVFPELGKYGTIWREMYKEEKPSPEALNLTMKKMGINNDQVIYVGDALNDYKTSVNANVGFIYFCPEENSKDVRIPNDIPAITNHKEIFNLINKV